MEHKRRSLTGCSNCSFPYNEVQLLSFKNEQKSGIYKIVALYSKTLEVVVSKVTKSVVKFKKYDALCTVEQICEHL